MNSSSVRLSAAFKAPAFEPISVLTAQNFNVELFFQIFFNNLINFKGCIIVRIVKDQDMDLFNPVRLRHDGAGGHQSSNDISFVVNRQVDGNPRARQGLIRRSRRLIESSCIDQVIVIVPI